MNAAHEENTIWKYLLPPAAAVLVVAAVVPRPTPPAPYRRYVSPPLPDGVRYTFLYPSALDRVFSHTMPVSYKGKTLQLVVTSKSASRLPGVRLWQSWFKPKEEFVSVAVEKPATKLLIKSSRSEEQSASEYGLEHMVEVDDPRAHEHFRFWHSSDFGDVAFKQHDQVVTDSFRVLLPGEPVPVP